MFFLTRRVTLAAVRPKLFSTMTAVQVHELGDESKLVLNPNVRVPEISPTECLVENHYAGLNFHDTYTRSGLYPLQLPFVVGCEGGGVVKRVGSHVTHVKEGDRVVYLQEGENGSYAQYTNVEHTRLMPVPDDVDLDMATAAAVQGLTAHYLVNDSYAVQDGDWCLVHAAAGGTGQIIVQMAKNKGARVIGTCSTAEKAEIAKARGCDFVILTKSDELQADDDVWPALADKVKKIVTENTDGPILAANYGPLNLNDGVHCVFDGVGKLSAIASLESLRPRGTAVFFGNASGAPPDIPPLLLSKLGSLSMTRPKMHDFVRTREELVERSSSVFQMLQNGEIGFSIQENVKFCKEGVARATKLLQERKTVGKVLFDIQQGLASNHQAATDILASRQARTVEKIGRMEAAIIPLTLEDAYSVQNSVKDAIIHRGSGATEVVGKKIAATSTMAQESVRVNEPFYGNLFSHSTFSSPAKINVNSAELGLQDQFILIEPEFAVMMAEDLEIGTEHTYDSIKGSIGSIFPSVEIVTSAFSVENFEDFKNVGAPSLIADNASHGGLVLGKQFSATDNTNFPQVLEGLNDHSCSLEVNGDWCAEGTGDRVLGHPLHALCWLANQMGKRGETLKKGELITTGVVVDKLVVVNVGDTVNVNYGDLLGTVTFSFEK
jgi:NADPH:quinone reductase